MSFFSFSFCFLFHCVCSFRRTCYSQHLYDEKNKKPSFRTWKKGGFVSWGLPGHSTWDSRRVCWDAWARQLQSLYPNPSGASFVIACRLSSAKERLDFPRSISSVCFFLSLLAWFLCYLAFFSPSSIPFAFPPPLLFSYSDSFSICAYAITQETWREEWETASPFKPTGRKPIRRFLFSAALLCAVFIYPGTSDFLFSRFFSSKVCDSTTLSTLRGRCCSLTCSQQETLQSVRKSLSFSVSLHLSQNTKLHHFPKMRGWDSKNPWLPLPHVTLKQQQNLFGVRPQWSCRNVLCRPQGIFELRLFLPTS